MNPLTDRWGVENKEYSGYSTLSDSPSFEVIPPLLIIFRRGEKAAPSPVVAVFSVLPSGVPFSSTLCSSLGRHELQIKRDRRSFLSPGYTEVTTGQLCDADIPGVSGAPAMKLVMLGIV